MRPEKKVPAHTTTIPGGRRSDWNNSESLVAMRLVCEQGCYKMHKSCGRSLNWDGYRRGSMVFLLGSMCGFVEATLGMAHLLQDLA